MLILGVKPFVVAFSKPPVGQIDEFVRTVHLTYPIGSRSMDPDRSDAGLLKGIVELDEKYVGGKPQRKPGIVHKRSKGTDKP
jgi:hypothetical protein